MECEAIQTLPMGEIDYDELGRKLAANVGRNAIINVNIGTTVKGAVDNIDRILRVLKREVHLDMYTCSHIYLMEATFLFDHTILFAGVHTRHVSHTLRRGSFRHDAAVCGVSPACIQNMCYVCYA